MLYLSKNDKGKFPYVEGGKQPYFLLSLAPDKEMGETQWKKVAAFWLKNRDEKKFYTGTLEKGVELKFSSLTEEETNEIKQVKKDNGMIIED